MTPTEPTVRALVDAINAGDRDGFVARLAEDVTMSDDGSDHDPNEWIDREIFGSNGRMAVLSETDGGRGLVARFRNDAWGEMRTRWHFTVEDGKVRHFETGQA
ncbi:nuclear transport factor 2 family protein [Streptomyces sp. SID3343]|uniref:nuclear transport factor 2 family protein n=1 Tax=Streptomyces sp. SID3343 TaxID=2690260 RepID=UPI001370CD6F|nr:nuclear transport factor 2 family protein [Streptomyces sp. SID3343]MYW00006.1 nuclear transport factor 2 family protein [Streptomyces sp. SID3343]